MRISNAEIARVFELIGDLLDLKGGEDAAKASAYRRAARSIGALREDLATLHQGDRLREIPGVGEALARKISELVESGRLGYYERLSADIPPGVLELTRLPGVGARTAGLLFRELGVAGVDELEKAVREGTLRRLPGFGPKKEEALLAGIAAYRARPAGVPLGVARPVGLALVGELRRRPEVARADLAGGLRRWCEWVSELELVVAADDPSAVAEALVGMPGVAVGGPVTPPGAGGNRWATLTVRVEPGLEAILTLVEPDQFFTALQERTGSEAHHRAIRDRAARVGAGAGAGTGAGAGAGAGLSPLGAPGSEEDLYGSWGLPYIVPELREGEGEVEAAEAGRLPDLIELPEIRGDLHCHSDWSDGTASLEELAAAARVMGYEYLAVTDHSKSLAMARGLDEKRLLDQKEAIDGLNAELTGVRLLAGIEVDILAGGELDLPDPVLAEMDVVVASLHSGLRQPSAQITERLVRATENEQVDIIGHPSGRLIDRRAASALDLDALIEAAAARGVLLEINSSPERLDLRDVDARRASAGGCRLSLGTDAHSPRYLGDMVYGLATARRAWLQPDDVANTRSWPALRKLLRRPNR